MGALRQQKIRRGLLFILCIAGIALAAVSPQPTSAATADHYDCLSTDAGYLCRDKVSDTWWKCAYNGSWSCQYYYGPVPAAGDKEILEGLLNSEQTYDGGCSMSGPPDGFETPTISLLGPVLRGKPTALGLFDKPTSPASTQNSFINCRLPHGHGKGLEHNPRLS